MSTPVSSGDSGTGVESGGGFIYPGATTFPGPGLSGSAPALISVASADTGHGVEAASVSIGGITIGSGDTAHATEAASVSITIVGISPAITPSAGALATPTYSWAIGNWRAGRPNWELSSIQNRSLKIVLNDVSTATFTVPGDHVDATYVEDLVSDVYVMRNGTPLIRARVTDTGDDIQETTYNVSVTASSYEALLDRRLILVGTDGDAVAPGDQVFVNTDQADIVNTLLKYAQAKINGDLDIKLSEVLTGVLRSLTFTVGSSIWASIKSMITMQNGFDFNIDTNLKAKMTYPAGGVDHGAVLSWGGNLSQVKIQSSSTNYFNTEYVSGGSPVGAAITATPVVESVPDIETRFEGRFESSLSYPELIDSDSVQGTADYMIQRYGAKLQPSYSCTMTPGSWNGPGHIWIGDVVQLSVHRGRQWIDESFRVYELDIALDQNDIETVSFVLGTLVPDDRSVLRFLARKLGQLAKQG